MITLFSSKKKIGYKYYFICKVKYNSFFLDAKEM